MIPRRTKAPTLPLPDPDGKPLTTTEVAALFGVDSVTVVRWADAGLIPHFRTLGGHRRFYRADVDALRRTTGGTR